MQTMTRFSRRQYNISLITLFSVAEIALGISLFQGKSGIPAVCLMFLFAFGLFCFYSLEIMVLDKKLLLKFGGGVIVREIPLPEVVESALRKNAFWSGAGIRYLRKNTWLYSVSGKEAVELRLRDGTVVRVGTDAGAALLAAVREAI